MFRLVLWFVSWFCYLFCLHLYLSRFSIPFCLHMRHSFFIFFHLQHHTQGGVRYAVVVLDYFTKKVEAKALKSTTTQRIIHSIWKYIISQFDILCKIISDNGRQFDNDRFWEFCWTHGIKNAYAALVHPQSNGWGEATNKVIKHHLKIRLVALKGEWVNELPHVLWVYRITPRMATGETLFCLA